MLSLSLLAASAHAQSFCNAGAITIPTLGAASPYPSTINVSGVPSSISKVTVELKGLNHTLPNDIDMMLVGPTGQNLIIMSDVGAGADIVNVNLNWFHDAAIESFFGTLEAEYFHLATLDGLEALEAAVHDFTFTTTTTSASGSVCEGSARWTTG